MTTWQLQTAKNQFSEVVERALHEGPQTVTRRGVETAVVLSVDDYHELLAAKPSFKDFLMAAPLEDAELARDRDTGRDADL